MIGVRRSGPDAYTEENAPCVCCSGKKGVSNPIGTHKQMHDRTKKKLKGMLVKGETLTYEKARKASAEAHNETFKDDKGKPLCSAACLEAQIDAHMENTGTGATIKVRQKDGATKADYSKYKKGKVR